MVLCPKWSHRCDCPLPLCTPVCYMRNNSILWWWQRNLGKGWHQHCLQGWFDRTIGLQKGDVNTACTGGLTGLSVYRKVMSTLLVLVVWQDYRFTERWCQHCVYRWFDRTISLWKGDVNTVSKYGLTGLSVYGKVTSTLPARVVWHDYQFMDRWCQHYV